MTKPYLKLWDANKICDICGFKFKASKLKKTWDGYLACGKGQNDCWYPKHPFDYPLPIVHDGGPVYNARPEPTDQFVTSLGRSIWGQAWFSITNSTSVDPTWDELTDFWENY